jgi:hypothetical protein
MNIFNTEKIGKDFDLRAFRLRCMFQKWKCKLGYSLHVLIQTLRQHTLAKLIYPFCSEHCYCEILSMHDWTLPLELK